MANLWKQFIISFILLVTLLQILPIFHLKVNQVNVLKLLWKFHCEKDIVSNCAIGDIDGDGYPEIIIGSVKGYLYAINGEDGTLLWKFPSDVRQYIALGDVDCDELPEVIAGSFDGYLYVINGDGSLLWKFKTLGAIYSPSVGDIDGDGCLEIVFGGTDGYVYALNGEDGSLLWKKYFGTWVAGSIALGDIDNDGKLELVFGDFHGMVYALNGEDGSLLWSFNTTKPWVGDSISLGDVDLDSKLEVLVGTFGSFDLNDSFFVLNGEDGSLLWAFFPVKLDIQIPAIGDLNGDAIPEIIISDGYTYCLEGPNGTILWKFYPLGHMFSSPVLGDVDGDNRLDIVFSTSHGWITAIDGETGQLLWEYYIGGLIFSVNLVDLDGDGDLELVCANDDGYVYAFDILGSGFRIYWQAGSGDTLFMRQNNQFFADRDHDYLSDYSEIYLYTDPLDNDTDDDGIIDGLEVYYGTDPGKASSPPSFWKPNCSNCTNNQISSPFCPFVDNIIYILFGIIFTTVIVTFLIIRKFKTKS